MAVPTQLFAMLHTYSPVLTTPAGADPLPLGAASPPSLLLYPQPHPLSHCNKPGTCSAAEVDRIRNASLADAPFPKGFDYHTWRTLWDAQEAKAAILSANTDTKRQLPGW